MRAMLVTAGFGTRLSPLTDELPKPAVPVANRPLAAFALDVLAAAGFTTCVLNTHHLAERFQQTITAHAPAGMALSFSHESKLLGTGGGIRQAWRPQSGEDLLVFNGKLLFAPDLSALCDHHRQSGAIATMVLQPMDPDDTFGAVEVDRSGRVRRLLGVPTTVDGDLRTCKFTGVHILSERAWRDLPVEGCVIREAYRGWVDRGEVVASVMDGATWRDLGMSCSHYMEGNLALASGLLDWPGIQPDNGCILAPDALVGEGALLQASVVGPGARVEPGVHLENVVLWPNAEARHDLRNTVVTSSGAVVAVAESPG